MLRHGHGHLTDMLSHGHDREHDQESRAVLHEWAQTFLQLRNASGNAPCATERDDVMQSHEEDPATTDLGSGKDRCDDQQS